MLPVYFVEVVPWSVPVWESLALHPGDQPLLFWDLRGALCAGAFSRGGARSLLVWEPLPCILAIYLSILSVWEERYLPVHLVEAAL